MKLKAFALFFSLGLGCLAVVGCNTTDEDAVSGTEDLTTRSCAAVGGECRSSPNEAAFPANCEDDFGRATLRGTCKALNTTCCEKPSVPDPPRTCEAAGGECLSSPVDPRFPASCLDDFARPDLKGTCGPNKACCEKPPEVLGPCESVGGDCRSSPNDPRFAANCEDDFGLPQLRGICDADNRTCCGRPAPPPPPPAPPPPAPPPPAPPPPPPPSNAPCEAAGGICLAQGLGGPACVSPFGDVAPPVPQSLLCPLRGTVCCRR